ncbi:MAG: ABC transporter substrate-binding protein [Candidatus Tectomicrobia bacterium]|nr:ABC transporter substrate-binding protein [Candidatus Tectomicrobia bacterium]
MFARLKIRLLTIVFLSVTIGLAWCIGLATSEETPKRGGTLTVGMPGDILNFDAFSYTYLVQRTVRTVYNSLMRYDDKLNLLPELVESWEAAPDGLSLTLHLRRGVKFHSGREFTAQDVVANLNRAKDQKTGGHLFNMTQTVASAEAMDKYTVKINYSAVTPEMYDTMTRLYIIDPEAFEDLKKKGAGTGPFKLVEWQPGEYVKFKRHEDYWDKGRPYVDELILKPFNDIDAMVIALESGTVDLVEGVPYKDVKRLSSKFKIARGHEGTSFYTLYCSPKLKPFDDAQVRRAMQYALNRQAIVEAVLYGTTSPTTSAFPPTSLAFDPKFDKYYPFDLEMAKKLIAQAGYPNGFKATVLATTAYPEFAEMAQIFKSDLAKIGVDLTIETLDPAQWYPKLLSGNYQMTFSFAGLSHTDPSQLSLNSAYRLENNPLWEKVPSDYFKAGQEGRTTLDVDKRKKIYADFQVALLEGSWAISVAWRHTFYGLAPYVKGFDSSVDHNIMLDGVWLAK